MPALPPLKFTDATPGYVKRAYRIIWNKFGMDIRQMPSEDWTPILIAAVDNAKKDGETFAKAVIAAAKRVARRKFPGPP